MPIGFVTRVTSLFKSYPINERITVDSCKNLVKGGMVLQVSKRFQSATFLLHSLFACGCNSA